MSKEQSLRKELEYSLAEEYYKTAEFYYFEGSSESNVIENAKKWAKEMADAILKAIDSRLPKEREHNSFDEDYINGYNQALSDVRKELGL